MLVQDNFDFSKDYCLEDERVILRPLCSLDAAELATYVSNEPEIWKYSLVAIHKVEDLNGYIETAIQSRKDKTAYPFIVFDKQLNKYVGSTRFYDIQWAFETMQLGYTWYSKEVWGTGLNAHCKYLLLQFAFEQMGCKRVEFRADNDNKRSIAAMQKIGCTVEGVLRSHLPRPDGTRRDSIVLSITKEEWEQKVKALIKSQIA
jgi:RimJ/RimL family protein N-acetyltransferase